MKWIWGPNGAMLSQLGPIVAVDGHFSNTAGYNICRMSVKWDVLAYSLTVY